MSFAADPLDADDDLLGGETPDDDSTEERLEEDDDLDLLDEEEDDDFEFDTDEEDDLLGEEDGVEGGEAEQAEGSDTAALFAPNSSWPKSYPLMRLCNRGRLTSRRIQTASSETGLMRSPIT